MTHSYPKVGEVLFQMKGEVKALSKQRPRAGKAGHFFTPKRTRDYERAVREMAEVFVTGDLITCPVQLNVQIIHRVPKSWPQWKTAIALKGLIFPTHGDLDNKVKAISDALNGVVYLDDSQVCRGWNEMRYGETELVHVMITRAGYTIEEARRLNEDVNGGGA